MSSSAQLWDLYREWKEWTGRERAALHSSDWKEVQTCQSAKSGLRQAIIRETESATAALTGAGEAREFQARLREIVNELILLETENSGFLSRQIEVARSERNRLDTTARTLRQVHQRYVPPPAPLWNGYS